MVALCVFSCRTSLLPSRVTVLVRISLYCLSFLRYCYVVCDKCLPMDSTEMIRKSHIVIVTNVT